MTPRTWQRTMSALLSRDGRRGPSVGARRRRRPAVEAMESRRLLSATALSEFTTTSTSYPVGIVAAPDGNLWITEEVPDQIQIINPTSQASSTIPLTAGIAPQGITVGPDGNIWITEAFGHNGNGQIAVINTTTHSLTELPPLPNAGSYPTHIVAGPDGNLWFTETAVMHKAQIGMVKPTTHAISEFPLSNPSAQPAAITIGPDGNLWFTEDNANQVGMIDPTTHAISEFPVPTANAQPGDITAGPDGNLWFTETNPNAGGTYQLGMINPTTHLVQEFPLAGPYHPQFIATGPDGNLWFTSWDVPTNTNTVVQFNPVTHGLAAFPTQTTGEHPAAITTGPGGNLWFDEAGTKVGIGEVSLARHLVVTPQLPAGGSSVAPGATFGLTVSVEYDTGIVDTSDNGLVTVALVNPGGATLGGTRTVTATKGVATFTGLSIDKAGSYPLVASTDPQTTALSPPLTVAVPTPTPTGTPTPTPTGTPTPTPTGTPSPTPAGAPPRIVAESLVFAGRGRRRRLVGIELDFSAALDPARATSAADYLLTQAAGRGRRAVAQAVGLQAAYDAAAHRVTLTLSGRPRFQRGGQLVVVGVPPGGITDATGVPLDGGDTGARGDDGTFVIAPKGRGISR